MEKLPMLTAVIVFAVESGDNVVTRNSADSIVTVPEPRSFQQLLSDVEKAIRGEQVFTHDKVRIGCYIFHLGLLTMYL
jgi:hypothetical protein